MPTQGLFVGLVTIDLVYLTENFPQSNDKLVANDYTISAGGPATNAAIAFRHFGNLPTILGVMGCHPMTQIICQELQQYNIALADLNPTRAEPPPVSSIIVTAGSGDRAVVSINATKSPVSGDFLPLDRCQNFNIVLIDGHQILPSVAIAQLAQSHQIPVVLDGGSWKPGLEEVLPFVNYAVCSANFYPPECDNRQEVFAYLEAIAIPHIAITDGANPIQYLSNGDRATVAVPQINPRDTLGAGDIFHGAFCHFILQQDFPTALASAAQIASHACQQFGTREWMKSLPATL